jgi:hypothetical protein
MNGYFTRKSFWITKAVCFGEGAGLALLLLSALSRPLMSAELSVACVYMALTESHEGLMRCGESISSDRAKQYALVRALLRDFINKNARADRDKISSDYDDVIRRHSMLKARDYICGESIYPFLRQFFMAHTTPGSVELLRKDLERLRDPTEGDCL